MELADISLQISNSTQNFSLVEMPDSNVIVQIALVTITAILAGITWKYSKKSNQLTRSSNELVKQEITARLRPWVYPVDFSPEMISLDDNTTIKYDVWAHDRTTYTASPTSVRVSIVIKNSGPLPAKEFRHLSKTYDSEPTKEQVLKEQFQPYSRDIMPGEETRLNIDLPWNEFQKEQTQKIWLACKLEYRVNKKWISNSGLIGYLFNGGAMKRNVWHDDIDSN